MKKEANVSGKTRKLVVIAMMVAIVEILAFSPLGMIIIPPVSATTVHIPVIVATILEGMYAGVGVGLAFGVTSIIRALSSPNFLDKLFLDPLVSVLPRMLIGVTTYYSYVFFNKILSGLFAKGNIAACFLAACVGSMTNTIGCMGMLYIRYAKEIVEQVAPDAGAFVIGIITTYGVVEMLVVATIVAVVVPTIKSIFYR